MARRAKITIETLRDRKQAGHKIPVLTCYDYPTARILEAEGVEGLLVGDTLAQVLLGHESTLPATMDLMVTLSAAVRRGAPNAFLIGDMPYLSCQISIEEAIRNAGRFMAEAGCDCVKIECDGRHVDLIAALARAAIPVMAHLGLRPQSIHQIGGYRTQATRADSALALVEDARRMEAAGACSLLLEKVPSEPARAITSRTTLPVIGCGAGPDCDGQVVVLYDILGLSGYMPRFVRPYKSQAEACRQAIVDVVRTYVGDVTAGRYPSAEYQFRMADGEAERLEGMLPAR